MFVFVPTPPLTPEADDLGQLIAQLVRDYQAENPQVDALQVQQALRVARNELAGGAVPSRATLAAALGAVLLLVAGVAVLAMRGGASPPMVVIILVGGLLAIFGAVTLAARRGGT